MTKPKPCPFCGEELVWEEHECKALLLAATLKYWKHPRSLCFASDFEVYPDEVPAWNRRAKA